MISVRELLYSVLILLLQEELQLVPRHLCIFDLVNLHLRQIDNFRWEGVTQDFIVDIVRPVRLNETRCLLFGDGEQVTLWDVVFYPEIAIVEDARIVERVSLREEVTHKVTILSLLRWIRQVGYHERSFDRILPHLPRELILVNKGELGASGVQQYLMHHVIRPSTVLNRAIENYTHNTLFQLFAYEQGINLSL